MMGAPSPSATRRCFVEIKNLRDVEVDQRNIKNIFVKNYKQAVFCSTRLP